MKKTKWSLLKFFNMKIKNQTEMIVDHRNTSIACVHVSPSEWYFVQSCLNFLKRKYLGFSTLFCRKKQFWHMNLTTWLCFSPQLWKCLKKCAIPWRNDFFDILIFDYLFFCGLKGHIRDEDYPYAVSYTRGRVRTVHAPAHCYNDWPSLLG